MILSWIVLFFEGLICCFFKEQLASNSDSVCFCVIGINAVAVVGELIWKKADKKTTGMILGGFVFRLFLLYWDIKCRSIYVLPNSGLDSEMYAFAAQSGYLAGDWGRGGMYAKYIAFWYQFFGIQRPIAQYTNILMALTIITITMAMMQYLKIRKSDQQLIVFLLCFLPNFALINSVLLRETIMMLTASGFLYLFVRWLKENRFLLLIASVVVCCIGALFHSGAIAPVLGAAVVVVLYNKSNQQIQLNKNSIFSIVFVVVAFFVLQSTVGDSIFGKFQGKDSVEDVLSTADSYNAGGSAYDAGFQMNNNIASLIINTPIRMFYFVASPVPWNWRGVGDIIAFVFSAMVYLYIYYTAIKELKNGNQNRTLIIVLLILSLATALLFAWGVSNAGSALRHREKFVVIYLLLLAVCRSGHKEITQKAREFN